MPEVPAIEGAEGKRAADLYERIFLGYGDDSVAQLGGAHIACEWTSNLLTKILQRPRLAAYLEQSTRYIAYDDQLEASATATTATRGSARSTNARSTTSSRRTAACSSRRRRGSASSSRAPTTSRPRAHARAVRAKALDLVRGLLPAATLSHVGIYGSGQTYEQLVLHLLAHPLAEARSYGQMLLEELQKIIPSFVVRVPREDRGGRWIEFLRERREAADAARRAARARRRPSRRRRRRCGCCARTAPRTELARRAALRVVGDGEDDALRAVAALAADERAASCAS